MTQVFRRLRLNGSEPRPRSTAHPPPPGGAYTTKMYISGLFNPPWALPLHMMDFFLVLWEGPVFLAVSLVRLVRWDLSVLCTSFLHSKTEVKEV